MNENCDVEDDLRDHTHFKEILYNLARGLIAVFVGIPILNLFSYLGLSNGWVSFLLWPIYAVFYLVYDKLFQYLFKEKQIHIKIRDFFIEYPYPPIFLAGSICFLLILFRIALQLSGVI